jgi:hypothetical protein
MKYFAPLALLFLKYLLVYSQLTCKYYYVLNNRIVSNDSVPHLGIEFEFYTSRNYYNSSRFQENRIFTGSNDIYLSYKIENGIWYYKNNRQWKLLYNYGARIGGKVNMFSTEYIVMYKKELRIRDMILHEIVLEPISFNQSHNLHYYFNPLMGVVIIKSSNGIILIRSDCFNKPLDVSECSIL